MTVIRTLICLTFIVVITLGANYSMSKYQKEMMDNATEYADLMADIPTEFGVWKRTKTADLPWYAVEQLKVRHAEHWTYQNTENGDQVNVSFLIGPTGRLSVHTAEACMNGEGFVIHQERKRELFPDTESDSEKTKSGKNDNGDEFWRVSIVNKMAPDYQFVVYYALGTGKRWWAKDDPRYELSHYPFVLKMQVETVTSSDPENHNAARKFLKDFLPEIARVYANTDLQGQYGK
jgi:uncharacterized protein (DUF2249 family)